MGKHRAPNRPACGCAEGYYVQTVGVVRREVLAPAVHDCEYVRQRNDVLAEAERHATICFPRPTVKRLFPAWRAVWAVCFHESVARLYWGRWGYVREEKTAGPVAG